MVSAIDQQFARHAAAIRGLGNTVKVLTQQNQQLAAMIANQQNRPRSVQEEIDAIEGRRIEFVLSGEVTFTAADVGNRAQPILFQISQDGPFVQTHYPMAVWRPTAPGNATNLNRWRPVSSFPLPTQQLGTDIIDIQYEMQDGGNQRLMQNEPRGPILSRPDNMVPTPVPTLWSPNAAILFTPTYLALTWNSTVPPTEGTLHVDIPGYRIINM